jgi:hypothetical protein
VIILIDIVSFTPVTAVNMVTGRHMVQTPVSGRLEYRVVKKCGTPNK